MFAAPYAYGAVGPAFGYGWGHAPFMAADGLVGFNKKPSAPGLHLQELSKKVKKAKKAHKKQKKVKAAAKKPNFEKLLNQAGFSGFGLPEKFQKLLKNNGFTGAVAPLAGFPAVAGNAYNGAPAWNMAATGGPMTTGYEAGAGVTSPYGANVEAWPASPYGDLTAFSNPANIPLAEDSTTSPFGRGGQSAVPNPVDALTAPLAGDGFGAGAAANNRFDNGFGANPYGAW